MAIFSKQPRTEPFGINHNDSFNGECTASTHMYRGGIDEFKHRTQRYDLYMGP